MARLMGLARRSPLATFFSFAFLLTWALLPFAPRSMSVALLSLFGPAAAALITAALSGRQELRDLRARVTLWRVPMRWYLLALLLPLPISALASGIEYTLGARGPIQLQRISALGLVVFALVVGEEIGWRGFALPKLLVRFGPWPSSVILGVLWALWHLPLFYMAGMPQFGNPFPAFVVYTIALSVTLTVLAQHTRGSVVIATLFHGAVNTFGITNSAADADVKGWGNALAYGAIALIVGVAAWKRRPGLAAPLGLESKTVRVVPYDERWPAVFEAEARRIADAVAAAGLPKVTLEHAGSTAVPGLAAKPILDIAAGYEAGVAPAIYVPVLEALDYVHRGEQGLPGREFFRRGQLRSHHLHLVERGGSHWSSYLRFRDALRADAALRDAYASVKRSLAKRYPRDREAYTTGKAEFVERVLRDQ